MKKRVLIFIFAAVLCGVSVSPLCAQRKVTVKLASLVPENTPWGAVLNRMAVEWAQATGGEVELIIYHSGVAGDESSVLRKLRGNQIQAALFTSMGLNQIAPEIFTLSYPLLIRTNEEFDAVLTGLRPELDRIMRDKNYVTLAFAKAGWIKLFSRVPVFVPSDLRRQKLGSNPNELEMMQAFRAMGYQIIPVSNNDTLVSLNSGMIDSVYTSPIAAAADQSFGVAKNMSSLNIAPFMGSIVMNQTTWRRIPEKYRPALTAICKRIEAEADASFVTLEAEAIATMVRYGLIVNTLNAQQEKAWIDDMAGQEPKLVGHIFNEDIYRKIVTILNNYRARH
jgi:TRAP-type C4-dicarboxylate transport system substrate-binding protein